MFLSGLNWKYFFFYFLACVIIDVLQKFWKQICKANSTRKQKLPYRVFEVWGFVGVGYVVSFLSFSDFSFSKAENLFFSE